VGIVDTAEMKVIVENAGAMLAAIVVELNDAALVGDAAVAQPLRALQRAGEDMFPGGQDEAVTFRSTHHLDKIDQRLVFLASAELRTVAEKRLAEKVVEVEEHAAARLDHPPPLRQIAADDGR